MITSDSVLEDVRRTLVPERGEIPLAVYTDPEIYRLELETLFQRAWLFVAHESEVPQPGDFVVRDMGEQSVIVSRSREGKVGVFLNTCRHRAMRLACEDFGNTRNFRCPYHGFTYGSDGEFESAPFQRTAYPEGLDKDRLRLVTARSSIYRGLIFATWDHDGETLEEYLGDMAWYLDLVVGRGEMEVVGAPQRWIVPCAWKMPAENFCSDAYHTATTHAFMSALGLVNRTDFGQGGYHVSPGRGHGLAVGIQHDGPWYPAELREEYEQHLNPEQMWLMDQVQNMPGNVFPNFSFLIPNIVPIDGHRVSGSTLRLWQPLGPDRIQVWSWYLVEKNAPDWWKELGRRTSVQLFGSSGMFEQDDTENWENQTLNAKAALARSDNLMLHYSMGLTKKPLPDFPGPGEVYEGKYNEAAARGFYARWRDMVLDSPRKVQGAAR